MPPGGIRREIYRVSANPYHVQACTYAPKRMEASYLFLPGAINGSPTAFLSAEKAHFTKLLYSTRMAAAKSRLSTPKMMFSSSGPWLIMRMLMPA